MSLVLKDRVKVTSTSTGTGVFTLGSAVAGFQSFSVVGNGNSTYYTITDTAGNWEVGKGTYTSSGTTLSRDTLLDSSTGSFIDFGAGTKTVFLTFPAAAVLNGTFPFYKASGTLDSIGILTGNLLPFYNSSGVAKNIALTT